MSAIGRETLRDEAASANYRLRQVHHRQTGEISWEVIDAVTSVAVAVGLSSRDEALRVIRGWEQLTQRLGAGPEGHALVH